jgi:SagB-type dehydrogenase family enzyme
MHGAQAELVKEVTDRVLLSPVQHESSLAEVFHENTKLTRLNVMDYVRVIDAVLSRPELVKMMRRAYRVFSLPKARVALPEPAVRHPLEEVIRARRSTRRYTGEPLALDELSRLLAFSYGQTGPASGPSYFRAAPSGGALYPLEVYVAALRVEGLERGIYHYDVERHRVDRVRDAPALDSLQELLLAKDIDLESASAVFFLSAVFRRNLFKYQDRGYRMVLMEAGAAGENLTLVATSLGLGCVWLGGFLDDELAGVIGLDEVDEPVLVPIVVGRKAVRT